MNKIIFPDQQGLLKTMDLMILVIPTIFLDQQGTLETMDLMILVILTIFLDQQGPLETMDLMILEIPTIFPLVPVGLLVEVMQIMKTMKMAQFFVGDKIMEWNVGLIIVCQI